MCLALPAKIISIIKHENNDMLVMGVVDFSGITKAVSLAFVPEAKENDYVIVHAGFALSILDQAEAQETLNTFVELNDFERINELS